MVSSNITRPAVLFGVSCGAMTAYRRGLPQLRDEFFLTDGGIETTTDVLPHLRRAGAAVRHRADPRERHVARQRRLGQEARLRRGRAGGGQPARDRHARRPSRRAPGPPQARRHQRVRRPARGRLQPGADDVREGRRGVPRRAGPDVPRYRRRHGHRDHDELRGGGGRRRAGRGAGRDAGGDLVHGGDRRPASHRADRARRHRARRRVDIASSGLLHDQLRASDPISSTSCSRASRGCAVCAGCGRTRRGRVTPS